MKKSDKLLAKLGKSLDPERRPARAAAGRAAGAKSPVPPASAATASAAGPLEPSPPAVDLAAANPADAPPPTGESVRPDTAAFAAPPLIAPVAPEGRHAAAEAMIKRHLPYALGAGLIPLPLIDIAVISGVQLKLISELSTLYGVPFAANQAKAVVAALLGGAGSLSLATSLLGSLAKLMPGAGYVLGAGAVPLTAGALTYAIGHVFRAHFESGGTLLDFDAPAAKRTFLEKVAEGRATLNSL